MSLADPSLLQDLVIHWQVSQLQLDLLLAAGKSSVQQLRRIKTAMEPHHTSDHAQLLLQGVQRRCS